MSCGTIHNLNKIQKYIWALLSNQIYNQCSINKQTNKPEFCKWVWGQEDKESSLLLLQSSFPAPTTPLVWVVHSPRLEAEAGTCLWKFVASKNRITSHKCTDQKTAMDWVKCVILGSNFRRTCSAVKKVRMQSKLMKWSTFKFQLEFIGPMNVCSRAFFGKIIFPHHSEVSNIRDL